MILNSCLIRRCGLRVTMATTGSSSHSKTHTERTNDSYRSESFHNVVVSDIHQLSPTVKGYTLITIDKTTPIFKSGQWLDVHIPSNEDKEVVGGYSLTCHPNDHHTNLTLAIQYSTHPPTHWMHQHCHIGSQLKIRVGGDFYYDPVPFNPLNLLLLAGGIGINPIYSILGHQCNILTDLLEENKKVAFPHTHLLYSARNRQELIFKDTISEWCHKLPHLLSTRYFVTREKDNLSLNEDTHLHERRIEENDIREAFKSLPLKDTHCYVCGPSSFIYQMTGYLAKIGMEKEMIHFEKWW